MCMNYLLQGRVELRGVSFGYGKHLILKDVELTIDMSSRIAVRIFCVFFLVGRIYYCVYIYIWLRIAVRILCKYMLLCTYMLCVYT